jgi:mono/diheme cytochrome c family protein
MILLACLLMSACQQRMANQPSFKIDDPSSFFSDGRSERPLVAGTVARGHLQTDLHLFTGRQSRREVDWRVPVAILGSPPENPLVIAGLAVSEQFRQDEYVNTFPFPVSAEVIQHGRDRFMIYCVVCHDPLGTGHGKIVERGYTPPPSYHIDRLRSAPLGHFFDVITNGYGSMPEYKQQVPPRDRWAIVAYIRALQLSQHFPEKDLSVDMRREWEEERKRTNAGGPTG